MTTFHLTVEGPADDVRHALSAIAEESQQRRWGGVAVFAETKCADRLEAHASVAVPNRDDALAAFRTVAGVATVAIEPQ